MFSQEMRAQPSSSAEEIPIHPCLADETLYGGMKPGSCKSMCGECILRHAKAVPVEFHARLAREQPARAPASSRWLAEELHSHARKNTRQFRLALEETTRQFFLSHFGRCSEAMLNPVLPLVV